MHRAEAQGTSWEDRRPCYTHRTLPRKRACARARVRQCRGCEVWPALFTLADHGEWPNGGELDMLEYALWAARWWRESTAEGGRFDG